MSKTEALFDSIDWDLLHMQKATLIRAYEKERRLEQGAHLDGLINLIEDMQDIAADDLQIWQFPSDED